MARIKTWEELTICDNFLFQKVMRNESLCKRLIEKLLNIKIKSITYPVTEKTIDISIGSKSIRLDLYAKTDEGTVVNIEMQTTDRREMKLPKRTRYYQSLIDLEVQDKGREYAELKKSYIIFICTFDYFKLGRKVYTFTNRCHECEGLELGDETCKIILNSGGTVGEVDEDIDNFLSYVNGRAAEGAFTQEVASEVERIKRHDEIRREYMSLRLALAEQHQDGFEEGKAEGRAEGREAERLFSIRSLMESLGLTAQQAMNALKISAEEQSKYLAQI